MKLKTQKITLLICLIIISISCQNNDNLLEESNEISLEEFSKKHVDLSMKIIAFYKKEKNKIILNKITHNEILSKKNSKELHKLYLDNGLSDTHEYLNLLQKLEANYSNFKNHNEEFKKLTFEQQRVLINNSLNEEMDKTKLIRGKNIDSNLALKANLSCSEQADIDMARCDRNQVIGLAFSWLGGVLTGGVGGVIGAAASSTAYYYCQEDAREDFANCSN